MDGDQPPKLYTDLARWWPLLSAPSDYAEESDFYQKMLLSACQRPARTLLELGSGGGNNASFLKSRFDLVLVEEVPRCSRRILPSGLVPVGAVHLRVVEPVLHNAPALVEDLRTQRFAIDFEVEGIVDAARGGVVASSAKES
jgi:hypothetical protein